MVTANALCLDGALNPYWLIIGLDFKPLTYPYQMLHNLTPNIEPDTTYLKPCYTIHDLFHTALHCCLKCHSMKLEWNSWSPSGLCEVHRLF